MKPAKFRYLRAETAEHAVDLIGAAEGAARILAGGQSLVPALSARSITASVVVDIMRCPNLDQVSQGSADLTIAAACRQAQIERSPMVLQAIPLLSDALTWVAMPQVRSRGTVVGCLAQANAGGEVPVAALALDAELNVLTPRGVRKQMSARDVYDVESGTRLPPHSLILSASFRTQATGEGWGFSEIQLRQGHFALVCCAVTLLADDNMCIRSVRIAVGGLTASPYRALRAENALVGEAGEDDSIIREAAHMAAEERPWPARTDLHATGAFRSKVAVTAVKRALTNARDKCSRRGGRNDRA
jgi:carbon-monoxide dehydrogenase medium subunit